MGIRTRTKLAIKAALFGGAVSYAERLLAEAEVELEALRRDVVQARARRDTTKAIFMSGVRAWASGFSGGAAPEPPRPPRDLN